MNDLDKIQKYFASIELRPETPGSAFMRNSEIISTICALKIAVNYICMEGCITMYGHEKCEIANCSMHRMLADIAKALPELDLPFCIREVGE